MRDRLRDDFPDVSSSFVRAFFFDNGHGDYKELFVRELMMLDTAKHGTYGSSASELMAEMAVYRGARAWLCAPTHCRLASELIP